MTKQGTLYLCPTPIGNLEDITLRALKILREADLIAAEDTRVTIKLLNHFEIKTPLASYHEHNKRIQGPKLISLLQAGKNIALVTDAGTPALSDPGEDLVKDAIEVGIKVVPLPGAAAAICALVSSGLSTKRFIFEGFLPKKARERNERLSELTLEERTLVFYEAPHRIIKTLKAIKDTLGNRRVTIAREMTKVHEEFIRGTIEEIIERFNTEAPRGEMVIVVEGAHPEQKSENVVAEHQLSRKELANVLQSILQQKITEGFTKKQALKKAAEELGLSRNEAYKLLIKQT
ncbi:MAG TPA: 16S rRNA (cytidine(1402)-2'-O)-methyltransferase [Thermoanaerobacterales bacterium]|jgi:16S rRNA (cytidine1402-2'-O)-methyltransferase|nr:16S rRNA (cytidine(1402)-2'-O)-methyltransferase [Thermoanaerobacterales bacterium]